MAGDAKPFEFAGPAILWHVFKMFWATVFAVVLLAVDPFDLDRGVGERGRAFFYKIAAFAYPEARSPRTFVVLLDDAYLNERDLAWPLPYQAHAGVIDLIASRQPAAIFIDFTFIDPRDDEGVDYLVDTLRRVAERTPVFIASGNTGPNTPDAREQIQALEAAGVRFVSITTGADLGDGRGYPLATLEGEPPPAAVALYERLCATPGACAVSAGAAEMDIWWGVRRRDDFNCRGDQEAVCARLDINPIERAATMLASGLGVLTPDAWRLVDPVTTPYAPWASVSDLLNGRNAAVLGPRMEHAVVIYGTQLSYTGDADISPVHGPLAGAHAHAMAYDNLVTLSGDYVRAPPALDWDRKAHMVQLTCILAALALLARIVLSLAFKPLRFNPDRKTAAFNVSDGLVLVIGALVIAYIEFQYMRIGPMMWAPILAAAAAGNVLADVPWASWLYRKAAYRLLAGNRAWS